MKAVSGRAGQRPFGLPSAPLHTSVLLLLGLLPLAIFAAESFEAFRAVAVDVDGASHEGGTRGGLAHGRGRMEWPDGRVYEGRFRSGRPDGDGVLSWPDGSRYEGEFEAGRIEGEGRLEFADGRRYVGALHDGVPDGLGTLRWADRARFTGEYVAGRREGWGEFRAADGERYVGGYADGVRAGQGTLIGADGTLFRGAFRNDVEQGYGVRVSPNGSSLTLEFWENGVRQHSHPIRSSDECRLRHARRRWMIQESGCVDGLAHGRGRAVSLDGTLLIEQGRFVLGRLVQGRAVALGQPEEDA